MYVLLIEFLILCLKIKYGSFLSIFHQFVSLHNFRPWLSSAEFRLSADKKNIWIVGTNRHVKFLWQPSIALLFFVIIFKFSVFIHTLNVRMELNTNEKGWPAKLVKKVINSLSYWLFRSYFQSQKIFNKN